MKVKELKEILQACDPDFDVIIGDSIEIKEATIIKTLSHYKVVKTNERILIRDDKKTVQSLTGLFIG